MNRAGRIQQTFVIICQAAEAGVRCPKNREIGDLIGAASNTTGRYIGELVEEGAITIGGSNPWRIVTITATGKVTASRPVPVEEQVVILPKVSAIIADACAVFGVAQEDMTGRRKIRDLFKPRAAVAAVAHECGRTFSEIGRRMNRDHTTISNAYRAASDWQRVDPEFAARLNTLRALYASLDRAAA